VDKLRLGASSATAGNATESYWTTPSNDLLRALGSSEHGLSQQEADRRLTTYGKNSVTPADRSAALILLLRQFASPLVLILVFAAGVSLAMRNWVEAMIVLAIILGSCLLGFAQEFRASNAIARLRKRMALTVRARRDGVDAVIDATAVVPGDVLNLSAGNLIAADGVVLAANDFLVSESALTGESFPVEKRPGTTPAAAPLSARTNCVFQGTSVRSGTASVLVVKTGRNTIVGTLAHTLNTAPPETDFARGVRHFGYLLLRVMLVIVVFVLAVNFWLGRPTLDSVLFAVALAVGLSPELLPAIVSVTLSHGARAMAKRGVLVRRLEAIENLGSMNVFCTDKTGTLTAGVIALDSALGPRGEASVRAAQLAYLNAAFETGIENPLDRAIVAAGEASGQTTDGYRKADEIPYDFVRKRLTIVVANESTPQQHLLITKGAFAQIIALCKTVRRDGVAGALETAEQASLQQYFEQQSKLGFRVLAIATRELAPQPHYNHDDETALCFEGFLQFFDPPKKEAAKTIQDLADLGIRIKIITGDNRYVAAHVAEAIGLGTAAMLTGAEIAAMRDEALWHLAPRTDLFVEVDPQQKERIVLALQHAGNAVGYLGDGINDAPALKAADVGISVDQAVDVARESADVILLQPDLDVLRQGVEDGRRTFANTLKYINITTSANFGNMISMALATPVLPFLPLAAKQILLNNFLSDLPSIAISTDRVDVQEIERPQRWDIREIRRFMIIFGLVSTAFDLLTFWLLLHVFGATEAQFQTAWFVVSLLTELAVVLVLRTRGSCFRSRPSQTLLLATASVGLLTLSVPFLGSTATAFGFVPLSAAWMLAAGLIVAGYVATTELVKGRFYRRH
jgi:P-type Mg2+ transporter